MVLCAVCEGDATVSCSCATVSYCSTEHQTEHWKTHKSHCKPYVLKYSNNYGRYLVAARDLRPGEIIIKELPLVAGPKQLTIPICLGCHVPVDGTYLCSKCGWPLCGPKCESSADHQPECELTSQNNVNIKVKQFHIRSPMYECIVPFRCYSLKSTKPDEWKRAMDLQSHAKERKDTDIYKCNQVNVITYLKKVFKVDIDDEVMHKICGILDVNCFEIKTDNVCMRGLYPTASLMMHQCIPNTMHTFHDKMMTVRAAIPIKKGEFLSTKYTHIWCTTMTRREHLKSTKYFDCECDRCADPTEKGTYFSALQCPRCPDTPVISTDPLNHDAIWNCQACDYTLQAKDVWRLDQALTQELENLELSKENIVSLHENFLEKYKRILFKSHSHFINAKHNLLLFYGRYPGYSMTEITDQQLQDKENMGKELLRMLDANEPGISKIRGNVLYELHRAILEKGERFFENDDKIYDIVVTACKYLEEAINILKYYPADSFEGALANCGIKKMTELKIMYKNFDIFEDN